MGLTMRGIIGQLRLLLVASDDGARSAFLRSLRTSGLDVEVTTAACAGTALEASRATPFDCVIVASPLLAGEEERVLREAGDGRSSTPVVVFGERSDARAAATAMKAGATDYVARHGADPHELATSILEAIKRTTRTRQWSRTRTEQSDVAEHQTVAERAKLLARASKHSLIGTDLEHVLGSIAREFTGEYADWVAVLLRRDDGTLETATCTHGEEEREAPMRTLLARSSVEADALRAIANVTNTGHPELITLRPTVDSSSDASSDEHHALRALGALSAMLVPLISGGHVLGCLLFASERPERIYSSEDMGLAEEVGRRIAVVVENVRLFDLAQRERRRAEEASRLKDEFLAVLSHEIRTPLNAVLGWSTMLKAGALGVEQAKKASATIERNARSLAQLVDDLLDVSRIISGKLQLQVEPVDLVRIIESAIDVMRPAARAKGLELRTSLDPEVGPFVGDPDRLRQLVWNLLSNAVKFTDERGCIEIELKRDGSAGVMSVQDTGQGLSQSFIPYAFERFRQADMGTTRATSGLGLGLAIVREIAELHGGSVEAESGGLGKGSTFTLRLPIAASERATLPPSRPVAPAFPEAATQRPKGPPALVSLQGSHVLVVDDEPDARELLRLLFERCKATVSVAANANDAFATLCNERFDLVVSDIGLPGEDGYALIQRVRALPRESGGQTPAIALTAYARREDRMKALLAGFDMHVPKPVDPSELLAVVSSLVRGGPEPIVTSHVEAT